MATHSKTKRAVRRLRRLARRRREAELKKKADAVGSILAQQQPQHARGTRHPSEDAREAGMRWTKVHLAGVERVTDTTLLPEGRTSVAKRPGPLMRACAVQPNRGGLR